MGSRKRNKQKYVKVYIGVALIEEAIESGKREDEMIFAPIAIGKTTFWDPPDRNKSR